MFISVYGFYKIRFTFLGGLAKANIKLICIRWAHSYCALEELSTWGKLALEETFAAKK